MSTENDTLAAKFDAARKKLEEAKAALLAEGKSLFKEMCDDIFARFPSVHAIAWTQYTPYFNDGDACTFGVNDAYFYTTAEDDDEDEDDELYLEGYREIYGGWKSRDLDDREVGKACDQFTRFICQNEEILQSMFGDHCRVAVTRDGVEIDEYSHD